MYLDVYVYYFLPFFSDLVSRSITKPPTEDTCVSLEDGIDFLSIHYDFLLKQKEIVYCHCHTTQ